MGKNLFYNEIKNGMHVGGDHIEVGENPLILFKGKGDISKLTDFYVEQQIVITVNKKGNTGKFVLNPIVKTESGLEY